MKIKTFVVGPLDTNCYVVSDGTAAAVIDPGFEHEKVLAYLKRERLRLHYILLTHGHFDHIFDAAPLKEATGAAVVISAADADCLISPIRSLSTQLRARQPVCEADIEAYDGLMFAVGNAMFTYMLTPGHTTGSACIISKRAIFTGDTLFYDDCGRTDLPGGRYSQMLRSLKRLCELEGDYDIYPGHDRPTTLARERELNLSMKSSLTEDLDALEREESGYDDSYDDFEFYDEE